ncbi:MAG: anaerobic ribonucleoside-triphosphate reductase activating protein [Desulfobacteraceae bacterium]|nr:anaerobic ribonucleoside-triphosphate reductase activating protein [Desulfobacteraceae bacterium]
MHISGLQKFSSIDYPPLISCVIFTAGCNFHCPYCHNPELAAPGKKTDFIPEEQIFNFLHKRKKYLDAVVISGGEPTLQSDLADLCREIKSMDLALKIDTNGSRPDVIKDLIKKGLPDYIAMDIKTAPDNYNSRLTKSPDSSAIRESARIILQSGLAHEFRTTCVNPFTDESTIKGIAELVRGADLHAIQRPETHKVLSPKFFEGKQRLHSEEELERFRTILADSVKQAIIR